MADVNSVEAEAEALLLDEARRAEMSPGELAQDDQDRAYAEAWWAQWDAENPA
jgi:hypothetical protein